jgi:acetyl esterase/lipase
VIDMTDSPTLATIVYFLFALTCSVGNVAAWRPFSRHRVLAGTYSWVIGLLASEFPLPTLLFQLVATVGFYSVGWVSGWLGVLGLLITVLTWALLLALARVSRRAAETLDAALADALGEDYQAEVVHPRQRAVRRRGHLLSLLRAHRTYAASPDLSYGPEGQDNLLDVWHLPDLPADARAPVLIQIPGGAWVSGKRTGQAYPLLSHLVERGWVCVAINYRLSPTSVWPAHIVDVKRAIGWVKEHIAEHGGDPDFVVVTGGSAGGHLSALAALTPNDPAFQPGFEDVPTDVAAAVSLYPNVDWTDRDKLSHRSAVPHLERTVVKQKLADAFDVFDAGSPMSRISSAAPPFFLAHGRNDSMIPVELSAGFARMLRESSEAPVVYAELPRTQHAFDFLGSVRTLATVDAVDTFLGVVYGRAQRDRPEGPDSPVTSGEMT